MHLDCILEFRHHPDYEQYTVPIHRHRWQIRLTMGGGSADGTSHRARILSSVKAALQRFDRRVLNEVFPFTIIRPTHENIARCLFNVVDDTVKAWGGQLRQLSVWEDFELIFDMDQRGPEFESLYGEQLPLASQRPAKPSPVHQSRQGLAGFIDNLLI